MTLTAVVVISACLAENPDFDEPATTTEPTSSATEGACEPDGFEPNDETHHAPISLGHYQLVLESVDAVDDYSLLIDREQPHNLRADAGGAAVRVCVFAR